MESTTLQTKLTAPDKEYLDKCRLDGVMWKSLNTVEVVTYSLVFVLGTIGNGLVISITGFRIKKTINTVWILSLAIADFTFSVFLIVNIVHVSLEFHWPFGRIMCKLRHAIVFFNLIASIYTLVVISIDRCLAVWCPVWARNHRTPQLASFVVLGVWILALGFCSPNFYFKETSYENATNKTYCRNNYGKKNSKHSTRYAMAVIQFMFGFIIPFCVIAFCYGAIVVRLRRNQLSPSSKPFKVITAVIVAFLVCWFPYHVFSFLKALPEPKQHTVCIGYRLSLGLAYVNSCLNPILYFCMGHSFKKTLRRSLLSAVETAFTEESNTKARSSAVLELHSL